MSGGVRQIGGLQAYVCALEGPPLDGERAATEVIGEAFAAADRLVVIPVERLGAGFLTLSTRIAGEVIQKFVNYGFRVVFVGDIAAEVAKSEALRDFVRESNRGRHVWFVGDIADLQARLASGA
jgi:hypothetical protein